MIKYYLHIVLLFGSFGSFSQLVTNGGQSPTQLVQNVLVGQGVTISNVLYTGNSGAIGSFTANGTNLGINSGIVITTGTIANTGQGPQGPNNRADAGIDNGAPGNPLFNTLFPGQPPPVTRNAAILEFDFIPYSDTVRFRYVFGSEEYPEYVDQPFNDVFGFFISGPGIVGQQNIAQVPGGGGIISINNVNNGSANNGPCQNCNFYVNNGVGTNGPFNSSTNFIQYDGYTKVMEAVSRVQCGQTYRLRIAIADLVDGIYDSGIFLEANSLTSKTPIDITYSLSQTAFSDPNILAEGCVTATVNLVRQANIGTSLTVPIIAAGTATQGIDYSSLPTSVTFAPNQTTTSFTFSALSDALIEGIETIILNFQLTDPCGNLTPIILNLGINDIQPVALNLNDTTVLCAGDNVNLIAFPSGGVGPYTFNWSTGQTTSSILVNPTTTTNYSLTITDNCLFQSATANVTVTVPIYPPIALTATADITEICPYLTDTLQVTATGGTGIYSYIWKQVGGSNIGIGSILVVKPSQTTTYRVVVQDQCDKIDSIDVVYTILSPPLLITMSPDVQICPGEDAFLSVTATGGFGAYYYNWLGTGQITPTITVNPFVTTTYTVNVSDDCQTFFVPGSTTVNVVKPDAQFQVSSQTIMEDLPITFQNLTINGFSYFWDFGDGQTSTLTHPNNTYAEPGLYEIMLIATDQNGCIDSTINGVRILSETYLYIPNSFTPDGDRFNNVFKVEAIGMIQFQIKIYNRWGELIFESFDENFEWDGAVTDTRVGQDGTYTYIVKYSTRYEINQTKVGHVTLLR